MPSYVPAKKNTAFITYVGLPSHDNALILQADPTLAPGDVKVAIDDGAPANLATLPVVDADFTKRVKVSLSAAEMNGDNITVIFSDASGEEWCDLLINIQTADRQINDLPTTTEFEARTLVSADYTIVSDLGVVQTGDSYAIVNGDHGLVSIQDDVDLILADTNELQLDWADGGRLDLIQDIIAVDTTTEIPALIATAQADIDEILIDTGTTLDGIVDDILVGTGTTIPGRLDTLDTNVFNLVTALITSFAPESISADMATLQTDIDALATAVATGLTVGQFLALK